MHRGNRSLIIVVILLGVVLGGVVLAFAILRPSQEVELSQRFNNTARIQFDYPAAWQAIIPDQNIIFLGDSDVLNQQVGASMTIQRNLRLTGETETLSEALALFLERGPLAGERAWAVVGEERATVVDDREALVVVLEGAEGIDAVPMHSEVTLTRADSGIIYVFALSAPLAKWPSFAPLFAAILDSVVLTE